MKFKFKISPRISLQITVLALYCVLIGFLLKMTLGAPAPPVAAPAPLEYFPVKAPTMMNREKPETIKKATQQETRKSLVSDESARQDIIGNNVGPISAGRYDPLDEIAQSSIGANGDSPGIVKLPAGDGNVYTGFYSSRSVSGRKSGLSRGGGADTEDAVVKALNYLRDKQNHDGSWGEPGSENQAALTGLAMLAFLGRGETPDSPNYGAAVGKGLKKLVELADVPGIERCGRGFGGAIVTYALAEAAAMAPSGEIITAMNKRVEFIIRKQNKFGSFYYNYDNSPATLDKDPDSGFVKKGIIPGEPRCDLSFAGWNIQALRAAWSAGADVPDLYEALQKCATAINDVHQAAGGGFSFGINGGKYEADSEVTPVGIYCLQLLGGDHGKAIGEALSRLKKNKSDNQFVPTWDTRQRFPLYVWYYQSLMLRQYQNGNSALWKTWNHNVKKMLTAAQQPDGSWTLPQQNNDAEIKFNRKEDYSLYCTAFGALILEVYYRYNQADGLKRRPDDKQDIFADVNIPGLDLLLTRSRAALLRNAQLQNRVVDVKLDLFKAGEFNGKPGVPGKAWEKREFGVFNSSADTIQVRDPRDFPQELAPMQRVAIYMDNLPQSVYGGLRLKTAIGSKAWVPEIKPQTKKKKPVKREPESEPEPPRYRAVQVLWNQKILRVQSLLIDRHYLEVLIPNDAIDKSGNLLEIRNLGTEPICFDFLEISSDQDKPAVSLQSVAEESKTDAPLKIHQFTSFKEPLPASLPMNDKAPARNFGQRPGQWSYEDVFKRGSQQQQHYLYQVPRDIVEWLWAGGNQILLEEKSFHPGEIFIDDLGWPKLSWYGFNRILRLFDGNPRKVICNVVPAAPAIIPYDLFWAATQNDNDTVTIQVNSYRFNNADLTVTCPLPWTGPTEVEIIKGAATAKQLSKFVNNGIPPLSTEFRRIDVKRSAVSLDKFNNNSSECGLFRMDFAHTGFTTIRLRRQGASTELAEKKWPIRKPAPVQFDRQTPQIATLDPEGNYQRTVLRNAAMTTATESDCYLISAVPAEKGRIGQAAQVVPWELQSTRVAVRFPKNAFNSPHGARLFFGDVPANPDFLTFWVCPRLSETWRSVAELRFQLQGGTERKFYEVTLKTNQWQQVTVPLPKGFSLSWGSVCIFGDPERPEYTLKTPISFELNGWAQYGRTTTSGETLVPIVSRVESRRNYLAVILLGKPGTPIRFQHRFPDAVMFKTPTVHINQLTEHVPGLETPSGNLAYDCIKTKTAIRFDQASQIARIEARFPVKFAQRWYEENQKLFSMEENAKIKQGLLSPLVIQIKSAFGVDEVFNPTKK